MAKLILINGVTCSIEFNEQVALSNKKMGKFGTVFHRPEEILGVVYVNVCGPSKVVSLEGKKWFVSFVDDYSRHVWVATMSRKGEVLEIFMKWKKYVERETGWKIKELHFDNAGKEKYFEDLFQRLCLKENIRMHFVSRETNGRRSNGGG